jgi:hypothetical protein
MGPDDEWDVEADKCLITSNGDLKFSNKQGALIEAFAAGSWTNVSRYEGAPTSEQIGEPTGELKGKLIIEAD